MLRERLMLPERSVPFPGKKEFKYLAVGLAAKSWVLVNEVEHMTFGQIYAGGLAEKDFVMAYASQHTYFPKSVSVSVDVPFPHSASEESQHPWAVSQRLGFLTSAPDRLGPGLELEMLVHLPGHVLARQLPQARNSMVALGLGFIPVSFTEGAAEAGLFLVKSRGNAGETMAGIYTRFLRSVLPLLEEEQGLQNRSREKHHKTLEVRVTESLQGLAKAEALSYPSLLAMGSYLRLGAYLGMLNPKMAEIAEELRVIGGSGHLGVNSNQLLPKEDEDRHRAKVVRLALERSAV
jgi:protein-arginine kinase